MKHKRTTLFCAAGALLLSAWAGLVLGANAIDLSEAVRDWYNANSTPEVRILLHIRLPRVLGAGLAGMGLAVSGVILQSVLGNPLASPNIIGINAGAGFFVLLVSATMPAAGVVAPFCAFLGALLAAALVLAVSARQGFSKTTVVLCGFAVSSIFSAGMNVILIVNPDAYVGSGSFLAGGLSGLTMNVLGYPAVTIGAGICGALLFSKAMNVLALGADAARLLGMHVTLCRLLLLSVAALLSGSAVCFAGMIGFVGLVAPHISRILVGQDVRWLVPLSALLGATFVIVCDLLSRWLFAPYELPVGILMSLIGGPFFIILLVRSRRRPL